MQDLLGQHATGTAQPQFQPELLPVRMVNEVVYCPRLFYL